VKKTEEIEYSNFFIARIVKNYKGKEIFQIHHIPADWFVGETNIFDREEIIDMGSDFTNKYCSVKQRIQYLEKELGKLNRQIVKKEKERQKVKDNA
jgi:transposase